MTSQGGVVFGRVKVDIAVWRQAVERLARRNERFRWVRTNFENLQGADDLAVTPMSLLMSLKPCTTFDNCFVLMVTLDHR